MSKSCHVSHLRFSERLQGCVACNCQSSQQPCNYSLKHKWDETHWPYRAWSTFSSKRSTCIASRAASSSSWSKAVSSAACMTVSGLMTASPASASLLSLALVVLYLAKKLLHCKFKEKRENRHMSKKCWDLDTLTGWKIPFFVYPPAPR